MKDGVRNWRKMDWITTNYHSSYISTYFIEGNGYESRKHQRSKQRCQDLGWKVHDRAQSFVLRSYTMHELRNQHISIGKFLGQ